eukprot:COSAG05_NODE_570_length_8623_cov_35.317339_5_plen_401_part_00
MVVGGGVMGFTSAVRLLESGFTDVTLVAESLTGITSKSSPAVFRPDWLGDTPPERVTEWGLDTRAHLAEVYREAGSIAGVACADHLEVYRRDAGEDACAKSPVLSQVMDGFRAMTPTELACHFPAADGGWHYSSFVIEGSRYLPYLQARGLALGLRIEQATVAVSPGTERATTREGPGWSVGSAQFVRAAAAAAQRPGCTIVVNAMGLRGGAECYPVRGQLVLVRAPYIKTSMGEYNTADGRYPTYIYPRRDHVVLGSTYLEHDGDKEVRDETTADIIARAAEFVPELATAKVLSVVVCIRPGRKEGVRMERETVQLGGVSGGGRQGHIVHKCATLSSRCRRRRRCCCCCRCSNGCCCRFASHALPSCSSAQAPASPRTQLIAPATPMGNYVCCTVVHTM